MERIWAMTAQRLGRGVSGTFAYVRECFVGEIVLEGLVLRDFTQEGDCIVTAGRGGSHVRILHQPVWSIYASLEDCAGRLGRAVGCAYGSEDNSACAAHCAEEALSVLGLMGWLMGGVDLQSRRG